MTTIPLIVGSATRPGRLHAAVTALAAGNPHGATITPIDLGQWQIAAADGRPAETLADDTPRLVEAIAGADAVILATPIYRASLTGVLKNALDQLPGDSLRDRPVGIVSLGGGPDHRLGAERHLRDILAFFEALTAPRAVYLTPSDFVDGVPQESALAALRSLVGDLVSLAGGSTAATP